MYCKGDLLSKGEKPKNIPCHPDRIYSDEWKGWENFLWHSGQAPFKLRYRRFKEARDFTRALRLKNTYEWKSYCDDQMTEKGTLPLDIPKCPHEVYKDQGWDGYNDWLGTVSKKDREYRPFVEARSFARSLNLKTDSEWRIYHKGLMEGMPRCPSDIPYLPDRVYKDEGWVSWRDWLGTKYLKFDDARAYARSLGLKSVKEWRIFARGEMPEIGELPKNIPGHPHLVYREVGWTNWIDWLGKDS